MSCVYIAVFSVLAYHGITVHLALVAVPSLIPVYRPTGFEEQMFASVTVNLVSVMKIIVHPKEDAFG